MGSTRLTSENPRIQRLADSYPAVPTPGVHDHGFSLVSFREVHARRVFRQRFPTLCEVHVFPESDHFETVALSRLVRLFGIELMTRE